MRAMGAYRVICVDFMYLIGLLPIPFCPDRYGILGNDEDATMLIYIVIESE